MPGAELPPNPGLTLGKGHGDGFVLCRFRLDTIEQTSAIRSSIPQAAFLPYRLMNSEDQEIVMAPISPLR